MRDSCSFAAARVPSRVSSSGRGGTDWFVRRRSTARTFNAGIGTWRCASELGFHCSLVRIVWRWRSASDGTETERDSARCSSHAARAVPPWYGQHLPSLEGRPPRCERVALRSMPVVSAGRGPAPVAGGRCWTARLLYSPAVPPGPDQRVRLLTVCRGGRRCTSWQSGGSDHQLRRIAGELRRLIPSRDRKPVVMEVHGSDGEAQLRRV